jgi:hypothetical protein
MVTRLLTILQGQATSYSVQWQRAGQVVQPQSSDTKCMFWPNIIDRQVYTFSKIPTLFSVVYNDSIIITFANKKDTNIFIKIKCLPIVILFNKNTNKFIVETYGCYTGLSASYSFHYLHLPLCFLCSHPSPNNLILIFLYGCRFTYMMSFNPSSRFMLMCPDKFLILTLPFNTSQANAIGMRSHT